MMMVLSVYYSPYQVLSSALVGILHRQANLAFVQRDHFDPDRLTYGQTLLHVVDARLRDLRLGKRKTPAKSEQIKPNKKKREKNLENRRTQSHIRKHIQHQFITQTMNKQIRTAIMNNEFVGFPMTDSGS